MLVQDMCKVRGGDCGVMSKRRAAILSVVIEGRTQAETARQHKGLGVDGVALGGPL